MYADTSVFGGAYDRGFDEASSRFFSQIADGRFQLVISTLVLKELEPAPPNVQGVLDEVRELLELAEITPSVNALAEAYIRAGVVSTKWAEDAIHVAAATVSRCGMIVSWNFKHIVQYDKIPLYNAVNTLQGYGNIGIFSPLEVVYGKD